MKKFNFLPYVLIFFGTFLVMQLIQGPATDPVLDSGSLGITMAKDEYGFGKNIVLEAKNNTEKNIVLSGPESCKGQFFKVEKFTSQGYESVEIPENFKCPSNATVTLEPGKKQAISLQEYTYTLFKEGRYKLIIQDKEIVYTTPEFTVVKAGIFTQMWRWVIYQPMLNALVALLIYIPGHSLGLGIIALTIIIRTILLVPSAKALRAQKRMQEIQPEIEKLKQKYGTDQARMAQETMALWKKHKASPMSSCLPLLIQMPILIALYNVFQAGLSADKAILIYGFLPEFHLSEINPFFLGMNLFEKNIIVLPLVVGVLQFIQMKLMMAKQKKAKKNATTTAPFANEMENANKIMQWLMPVMIAFFTTQTAAAVGLYWGTSTIYGILQQLVINNEKSSLNTVSPADDVSVRVINKSHGKTD